MKYLIFTYIRKNIVLLTLNTILSIVAVLIFDYLKDIGLISEDKLGEELFLLFFNLYFGIEIIRIIKLIKSGFFDTIKKLPYNTFKIHSTQFILIMLGSIIYFLIISFLSIHILVRSIYMENIIFIHIHLITMGFIVYYSSNPNKFNQYIVSAFLILYCIAIYLFRTEINNLVFPFTKLQVFYLEGYTQLVNYLSILTILLLLYYIIFMIFNYAHYLLIEFKEDFTK